MINKFCFALILLLAISLFDCQKSNNEQASGSDSEKDSADLEQNFSEGSSGPAIFKNLPNQFGLKVNETDFNLTLNLKSHDSLIFELTVISTKDTTCNHSIAGLAVLKDGVEFDEDEYGSGYLAEEFVYNGDCWIAIRIDMKMKNKIKILEADCKVPKPKGCSFESTGILRPIANPS